MQRGKALAEMTAQELDELRQQVERRPSHLDLAPINDRVPDELFDWIAANPDQWQLVEQALQRGQ